MEFIRESRLPAPAVPDGEIVVDPPPDVPKATAASPLARLLPVVMIVATVGMMALYFGSGAAASRGPMFMFFPAMMLMSVIGSVAYGARGTNRSAETNQGRRDYLRYLAGLDGAIAQTVVDQHASLHWSHPDPQWLWTLVGGRRMWERGPDDPDFCHVRLGLGDQRASTRLVAPDLGPADELDPVTTTVLRRLIRNRSVVPDVPIAVALRAFPVIAVAGEEAMARAVLRAMICQLSVLHGPDDIAVAAVVGPATTADWDWLKWLPHHQHPALSDGAGSARLVYASIADAAANWMQPTSAEEPRLVMIVDGGVAAGVEQLLSSGRLDGVTILAVGSACDELPGHGVLLHIDSGHLSVRNDAGGDVVVRPDMLTSTQALVCARRLAPYRPSTVSAEGARPSAAAGWLQLMGIDDPSRIDPARQWNTGRGAQSLRVPIGASEDGAAVELDIKEAARNGMGPHGLCVGATGSGKSEFLRTLTLGMIATHPPDALNLVLVDFKGGATFLGLERARHVAAVITNLADDAPLVTRMQDALAGEMNRRQELLRAAGNFANLGDYEQARSRGRALPPLPVLFIVVDEFSELLSQHPDFAELFVAIGRLGRSLGMHLLLASQRVDEGRLRGLETHLSYRICLKTFSASESRAVLGVPDAYHLPSRPGAAYLKTASGELVRFQTAFVSGPHDHHRDAVPTATTAVAPLVFTAAPVGQVEEHQPATESTGTTARSLLDTVLDRLAGHGTPAHRVWLPPLSHSPTLDTVLSGDGERTPLSVPIGWVDRPYEQRRDLLVTELAGAAGNVAVVGGPRSGKSTALRTLVLSLAGTHAPADVQFYCLDFGGGALAALRAVPHVGSVAGRLDGDLCRRTIAELESLIRTRETRFRDLGIDSVSEYRRRRAMGNPGVGDDPFGDVFLIIDGWATLRQEFDSLEGPVTALAAQGLSFGVHVVVAASRWAEMRPALKDQLGTRVELRLGDPADSEMDRKRARQLTGRPPGRCLTRDGREAVIALPRFDGQPTTEGLAEAIAAAAESLGCQWNGRGAKPVELLPNRVEHAAVAADHPHPPTQITLGLGERELRPVAPDFDEQSHLVVFGEARCGKTATLRLLCREIVSTNDPDSAQLEIVDFRRTLLGVVETGHLAGYSMSGATLTSRLPSLLARLQARMPGDSVTQHQLRTRSWWSGPEIYLVVDDYDLVAGEAGNPLTPLLEFLPHAKDLGLHVVVARRSGGAARAMFDPVLARLRELGCMGLMMSAGPDEGVLLGSVRPSPLPPGRGTLITRGQPDQLIQVAWTDRP